MWVSVYPREHGIAWAVCQRHVSPKEPPEEENPPLTPEVPPVIEIPSDDTVIEISDEPAEALTQPPSETVKTKDKVKKTKPAKARTRIYASTGDDAPVKTVGIVAAIAGLIALLFAIIGIISRKTRKQ